MFVDQKIHGRGICTASIMNPSFLTLPKKTAKKGKSSKSLHLGIRAWLSRPDLFVPHPPPFQFPQEYFFSFLRFAFLDGHITCTCWCCSSTLPIFPRETKNRLFDIFRHMALNPQKTDSSAPARPRRPPRWTPTRRRRRPHRHPHPKNLPCPFPQTPGSCSSRPTGTGPSRS